MAVLLLNLSAGGAGSLDPDSAPGLSNFDARYRRTNPIPATPHAGAPPGQTHGGVVEPSAAQDDLIVAVTGGLAARGPVGGPFTPGTQVFTLTNTGSNLVECAVTASAEWLGFSVPRTGAGVTGTVVVVAWLRPAACLLAAGNHTNTLTFANRATGRIQTRQFTLTVGQPDALERPLAGAGDAGDPLSSLPHLSLNLPATMLVGARTSAVEGRIELEQAPAADLEVWLESGSTNHLVVPSVIVVPAGQTIASFALSVGADLRPAGRREVLVAAAAVGHTSAAARVLVDNSESAPRDTSAAWPEKQEMADQALTLIAPHSQATSSEAPDGSSVERETQGGESSRPSVPDSRFRFPRASAGYVVSANGATNLSLAHGAATVEPVTYAITGAPSFGLVSGFDALTGRFTYAPAHGFVGADRISYAVSNAAATSAPVTVPIQIVPLPDADGDGIPDEWETARGLNPSVADADRDDDGDGLSNLQEYLANTDPFDPQSGPLRLTVTRDAAGRPVLRWQGVGGTRYRVQVRDDDGPGRPGGDFRDLPRGAADEIAARPNGAAAICEFTDDFSLTGRPPPAGDRYYRVKVVQR